MQINKYKMASLFAGVGGIDLAFERTGYFETVYANEIDPYATITYNKNFEKKVDQKDIRDVDTKNIPDIDIVLSGFPCQAFSIAGYQKGFEDEHNGDLFFETLRVIVAKQPKVIFLENVKNLVSHDKGKTFKIIREALEENGYHIKYKVLNAKDYGNIPQNRERIYIVGFKDKELYSNFNFPKQVELRVGLDRFIDFNSRQEEKYYYRKDNFKQYDQLKEMMKDIDAVYQWRRRYVRQNKSGVVPTLTANMGTGGHNVPLIISKYGFRKLTPRECFNIQGFPKEFYLPKIANSHLYKQAGNSVVIPVIHRIAESIIETLEVKIGQKVAVNQ